MLRETCLLLSKNDSKTDYNDFLSLICDSFKEQIDKTKKDIKYIQTSLIINYVLFILTLTINMKDYPRFVKIFLKKYFKLILNSIKEIKSKTINKLLLDLLSSLFTEEYKPIYFRKEKHKELEEVYTNREAEFKKQYPNRMRLYQKEVIKEIFTLLFDFNLDYDTIFNNYSKKISSEEKPIFKMNFIQSILRLIFYNEKGNYYNDVNYYEYETLKKIIDKNMEETIKANGDDYKTLFRKENIFNDVLKYIFFMFGNTTMIEAFFNPLKKLMKKNGIIIKKSNDNKKKSKANEKNITPKEFESLFDEMVDGFKKYLPYILRIILKIIYTSIRKYFTIEENNFRPLNTVLIFNFISSPRIQSIYSLNPSKYKYIRTLNRLLCNTCFNIPFNETDELYKYNQLVENNHQKLNLFFQKFIISINEEKEEEKMKIKNVFAEKFSLYPTFLFYWDSKFFYTSINEKMDKIIDF